MAKGFQNQSNKVHRFGILVPTSRNFRNRTEQERLDWHKRVLTKSKSVRAKQKMVVNENFASPTANFRLHPLIHTIAPGTSVQDMDVRAMLAVIAQLCILHRT
jgi:hypothetical protein